MPCFVALIPAVRSHTQQSETRTCRIRAQEGCVYYIMTMSHTCSVQPSANTYFTHAQGYTAYTHTHTVFLRYKTGVGGGLGWRWEWLISLHKSSNATTDDIDPSTERMKRVRTNKFNGMRRRGLISRRAKHKKGVVQFKRRSRADDVVTFFL